MIPSLISRSQVCDISWNRLIEQSGQSVPYGFSFYLDLACESWQALVWPPIIPYQIVMPLPVRRKFGKLLVYQPLFCQYLGIFSRSSLTTAQAEAFLSALSAHFSYISAYHFNPENDKLLQSIQTQFRDIESKTNFTYWLNLGKDYNEVKKEYSRDRRINLKRAENANWEILRSDQIHPLIFLFVQNHEKRIPGGVNPSAYDRLEGIFETMKMLKSADVWYAQCNGVIRAGILVVRYRGKAIYLFNAADSIGRKLNARTWLLDQYFRYYARNPFIFDFESPEIDSISSFYESFGSERVPYLVISKNKLCAPFRQLQNWRKKAKSEPGKIFAEAFVRLKIHFKRTDH